MIVFLEYCSAGTVGTITQVLHLSTQYRDLHFTFAYPLHVTYLLLIFYDALLLHCYSYYFCFADLSFTKHMRYMHISV